MATKMGDFIEVLNKKYRVECEALLFVDGLHEEERRIGRIVMLAETIRYILKSCKYVKLFN